MEIINKEELKELANIQSDICISIYIPTHRAGKEVFNGEDQILLKNQVQKVKNNLEEKGLQDVQISKLLQPVLDLLEDTGFWRHQKKGLALFLTNNYFKYFRLPLQFDEYCLVSHSFHLTQLLPLLNNNGLYYILALSLSKSRLYKASRDHIEEISLGKGVPDSLEESMKYTESERSLQHHSGNAPGGAGGGSGVSGIFHGQAKGVNRDERQIFIAEFFRQLEKGVYQELKETDAPLVLVGVDHLQPMFKAESGLQNFYEKSINGSPDEMNIKDIHQKTWQLVQPHFNSVKEDIINKYRELAGTGKTSYNLQNIVPAAVNGRVEAVFVAKNACQWGKYKEEGPELKVELHNEFQEDDDCLISMSALTTFLNGGKAFVVDKEEMPETDADVDIIAVYRY